MHKRLVQISFGDGFSGSAGIAILSSHLLSKINYDVTLIASKKSLTEKRALEKGVNVVSFDTTKNFKTLFSEVNQFCQNICPKVIISHHSLDRKIGMKLKRKYPNNFLNIAYRHNVTKSTPIIGPYLYNRYFDSLIACSKGVGDSLLTSGIKKNKVKVIYNGILFPENIDEISGKNIRKKYNLDCKIVIGLSTWFHKERKGFDFLFNAFSKLEEKYVLLLVGIPNSDQQNVIEYAAEFNIKKERMVMPGYVDNIWEYYKAMDLFLLPSRSEGFSLALLEAAAAKLPIIASNIPGTNEFIINNENGLLFELNNPDELLNGIIRLTNDKILSTKLAENANKKVLNNYTQENYIINLDNFLSESLAAF